MRRIVIVGTNTAVGKTWVTCALARELIAQKFSVSARKPVQSYTPGVDTPDSHLLSEATGEEANHVCPAIWTYPVAMAPPMAAAQLGEDPPTVSDLHAFALTAPNDTDFSLIELVGGVRSPIAADGDSVDLAVALQPDLVVLVSNCELGAINAIRLSIAALSDLKVVTYLNQFDESSSIHKTNAWFLSSHGTKVLTSINDLATAVSTL